MAHVPTLHCTFAVFDITNATFANIITRPIVANYGQTAGFYCRQSTTGQPDRFSSTFKYPEAPSLLLPICPPITAMKRTSYCQINGSIALWVVLLAWLEHGRPGSPFHPRGAFFVSALNARNVRSCDGLQLQITSVLFWLFKICLVSAKKRQKLSVVHIYFHYK